MESDWGIVADQRVDDTARERCLDHLSAAMATGRLQPDEFDRRSSAALLARTQSDLDSLVSDLTAQDTAPAISRGQAAGAGIYAAGSLILSWLLTIPTNRDIGYTLLLWLVLLVCGSAGAAITARRGQTQRP